MCAAGYSVEKERLERAGDSCLRPEAPWASQLVLRFPVGAEEFEVAAETLAECFEADELAAGADELTFELLLEVFFAHRGFDAFDGFWTDARSVGQRAEDTGPGGGFQVPLVVEVT